MAWLSDEEYTLRQENRDKSITARSARHMRTHCGKSGGVKLPCDYMTKKELRAMNGAVAEFNLRKPMSWERFKAMANDLQVEYINWIRDYFGAPDKYIAEMFGISQKTFSLYGTDLKLTAGKGTGNGKKKWEKESFLAWRTGVDAKAAKELVSGDADIMPDENASVEPLEPVGADICKSAESVDVTEDNSCPEATESPVEAAFEKYCENIAEYRRSVITPAIPSMGSMVFDCAADNALAVMENLLRHTKVKLTITWEVVE